MTGPSWLSAWRLAELIIAREVSAQEVAEDALKRVEQHEPSLHAFITLDARGAIRKARSVDRRLRRGDGVGVLAGIPVSIKDLYWTKGLRTTGGSRVYADFIPTEDSVCAARLRHADAVILGKTNTPEFGLGGRTTSDLAGETPNPWDVTRVSAGSSGGAAASVAVGGTPFAVGSDGGGSIRLPAAYCGVFGLHVSNGRIPRHGGFGRSLFLASPGVIAWDVRDAALLLNVLAGRDSRDATSMHSTPPDYVVSLQQPIAGLRLAWWGSAETEDADARVVTHCRLAAQEFEQLGCTITDLKDPVAGAVHRAASEVLFDADAYTSLGRELLADPRASRLLGTEARMRFDRGGRLSVPGYVAALRTRLELQSSVADLFSSHDLLLSPTTASVASTTIPESLAAFTSPINLAGVTAASIPCGFIDGVPVGLQVIAPRGEEARLLAACRAFQGARPWDRVIPDMAKA